MVVLHQEIFIPELSLAIEYHGEYHYHYISVYPRTQQSGENEWSTSYLKFGNLIIHFLVADTTLRSFALTLVRHAELADVRRRDQLKQRICDSSGVSLIVIPYWWDQTIGSVAYAIRIRRPDIHFSSAVLLSNTISDVSTVLHHSTGTGNTLPYRLTCVVQYSPKSVSNITSWS